MSRTRPGLPAETLSLISFFYLQLPSTERLNFFGIGVTKFFRQTTIFFLQNLSTVIVDREAVYINGNVPHHGFCMLHFDFKTREGIKAIQSFFGMLEREIFRHKIKHMVFITSYTVFNSFAYGNLGKINGIRRLSLPFSLGETKSFQRLFHQIFKRNAWSSLEKIDNFPFYKKFDLFKTFLHRVRQGVTDEGETLSLLDLHKFLGTTERPYRLSFFMAATPRKRVRELPGQKRPATVKSAQTIPEGNPHARKILKARRKLV